MNYGKVTEDGQKAYVVPQHEGKGGKSKQLNYTGTSLLSVPSQSYEKVVKHRPSDWGGVM